MARGRMLNNSISGSVKFHELSDDTCRLMATWIISHLDVRGVFYGDSAMVKSIIFPRRTDVTAEQVEGYLQEMEEHNLIVRFQAKGDTWQWWPGFRGEQVGLRVDRENPVYPVPPSLPDQADGYEQEDAGEIPQDGGEAPEDARIDSGDMPAEEKLSEVKLSEVKLSEGELPAASADASPPPKTPNPPSPKRQASQAMFSALAELCQIDLSLMTKAQRGQLNQSESKLRKVGITPGDLPEFSQWWSAHDWRGQKGEPPKPAQVRETWGQFVAWKDGGKRSSYGDNQRRTGSSRDGGIIEKPPASPIDPAQVKRDRAALRAHRAQQEARRAAAATAGIPPSWGDGHG